MEKKFLAAVVITVNLLICYLYLLPLRERPVWDLTNFYLAARIMRSGQVSHVYNRATYEPLIADLRKINERASKASVYYNRPAFELPLFLPLAFFSYNAAKVLAIATNLLLIGVVVWKLPQWLNCPPGVRMWLFAFLPFLHTTAFGQDDLLLTLMVAYGLRLAVDGRDRPAGALLALAAFKPQVIFLLPAAMIAGRRWKMLGWFAATGLGLAVFSVALVGPQGIREWMVLLGAPTTDSVPHLMGNLRAIAIAWGMVPAVLAGVAAGISFATVLLRRGSFTEMFSAALVAGLLFCPHDYMQDYSVLAIVALASLPPALRYLVLLPWPYFYPGQDMVPLILLAVACLATLAAKPWMERRLSLRAPATPATAATAQG